jgi:hypothetical protein
MASEAELVVSPAAVEGFIGVVAGRSLTPALRRTSRMGGNASPGFERELAIIGSA